MFFGLRLGWVRRGVGLDEGGVDGDGELDDDSDDA